MKEYTIKNSITELTIDQLNDADLQVIIENLQNIKLNFDQPTNCLFFVKGNSTVTAYDNSTVTACGNSTVTAYDNSTVTAYDNSTVTVCNNSTVTACNNSNIKQYSSSINLTINSKFVTLNKCYDIINSLEDWTSYNNVQKLNKTNIILYKRVNKDFKTQEVTKNETAWKVGTVVEHKNWQPELSECGEGKFHGCGITIMCDRFRDLKDDKYIAISVNLKDLYCWVKNPNYPEKIGFRRGKVMYECDKNGNKI